MEQRTKPLTGPEIDRYSRRLSDLKLVPPDATLSADMSFGPNLIKTTRAVLGMAGAGHNEKATDSLSDFLGDELDILGRGNITYQLAWLLTLLPDGHHMTPGEKINTVIQAVRNVAEADGGYEDKELVLDGTAPKDGRVANLIDWWNNTLAEEGGHETIGAHNVMEVQGVMKACGVAMPDLKIDGDWGQESATSLLNVILVLGSEIEIAHHPA